MRKFVLAIAGCCALAACKSTQTAVPPPAPAPEDSATGADADPNALNAPAPAADTLASKVTDFRPLADFGAIYFEFDSDSLTDASRNQLVNVADYLVKNPAVGLTVEGHCDDRGTSEYNLGLGDRRAKAIQTFLTHLGVRTQQLKTISYGEERPASTGEGEDSWSKNRRGEFIPGEGDHAGDSASSDEG